MNSISQSNTVPTSGAANGPASTASPEVVANLQLEVEGLRQRVRQLEAEREREKELRIQLQAEYDSLQHAVIARAMADITDEELERMDWQAPGTPMEEFLDQLVREEGPPT